MYQYDNIDMPKTAYDDRDSVKPKVLAPFPFMLLKSTDEERANLTFSFTVWFRDNPTLASLSTLA